MRMVQNMERLGPELNPHPLKHQSLFRKRNIPILQAGCGQNIPPGIAEAQIVPRIRRRVASKALFAWERVTSTMRSLQSPGAG